KVYAVLTRSEAKRSSEEDGNKEAEVEQPEEIVKILKLMKIFCHKQMRNIRKLRN
ncbi:hypothetical protein AVEN_40649-2-1, partial [Araneus ventricosus]